jgi:hypothetical protein
MNTLNNTVSNKPWKPSQYALLLTPAFHVAVQAGSTSRQYKQGHMDFMMTTTQHARLRKAYGATDKAVI